MPVRIRPATAADVAAFGGFRCAIGDSWTRRIEQLIRTELADALRDPDRNVLALVAIDDVELVGVAAIEPVQDEGAMWAIRVVATSRPRQRSGIGRQLLLASIEACADRGAPQIVLEAHRRNTPILRVAAEVGVVWVVDPDDPEFRLGVLLIDA